MKRNSRQIMYGLIFVLCILLSGCSMFSAASEEIEGDTAFSWNDEGTEAKPEGTDRFSEQTTSCNETICVHVCGCVKKPGLYELPVGSRIGNAIDEAGGFSGDAWQDGVNLAAFLKDGMQISVPSKKDASGLRTSGVTQEQGTAALVNINTATEVELTKLSGIGETRAKAIIAYREQNGTFDCIEDIKKVSGIGDSTYENIKNDITV